VSPPTGPPNAADEPGSTRDTHEPAPLPVDTPLREVTDAATDAGHDGQFQALDGAVIRCLTCDHRFPASAESADDMTRLEGASDPADLAIVIPLRCPGCGTHGVLVANYGPEASEAEADVLTAMPRDARRGDAGVV
jgi:hypothetical protein